MYRSEERTDLRRRQDMVHGCGNRTIKLLLFVSNLLIFVFGALIFSFSLWANLDKDFAHHLEELVNKTTSVNETGQASIGHLAQFQGSLWLLGAIGALLLVIGFLGCCGAACENICCLVLYFIVVAFLVITEIVSLVCLFAYRDEFLASIHQLFEAIPKEAYPQLKPIEELLKCCGATTETAPGYACSETPEYPDCYTVLSEKLDSLSVSIMVSGVLLLVVQLFSMILSCVLCQAFRKQRKTFRNLAQAY